MTKEKAEQWKFTSSTTGPIIGVTALTMLLLLGAIPLSAFLKGHAKLLYQAIALKTPSPRVNE